MPVNAGGVHRPVPRCRLRPLRPRQCPQGSAAGSARRSHRACRRLAGRGCAVAGGARSHPRGGPAPLERAGPPAPGRCPRARWRNIRAFPGASPSRRWRSRPALPAERTRRRCGSSPSSLRHWGWRARPGRRSTPWRARAPSSPSRCRERRRRRWESAIWIGLLLDEPERAEAGSLSRSRRRGPRSRSRRSPSPATRRWTRRSWRWAWGAGRRWRSARWGCRLRSSRSWPSATSSPPRTSASRAVAASSVRNIGVTADRLRRADLPRLARTAIADPQFTPGQAWPLARAVFTRIGAQPPPSLRLDGEPSPSKGARPLALLVDPPIDVRLSLRPAAASRSSAPPSTKARGPWAGCSPACRAGSWRSSATAPRRRARRSSSRRWLEIPGWLRAVTQLRGEPLDDVVHTEATRRVLAARRAAALVLFELRRREGPATAAAEAALYRGLLQRALFCVLSDDDAARWALEADPMLRTATPLLGAVLAAQLEQKLGLSGGPPRSRRSRSSGPAADRSPRCRRRARWPRAARSRGARRNGGPAAAYSAPDAPPPAQKPDYKYMQGDKRKRHRKKKK